MTANEPSVVTCATNSVLKYSSSKGVNILLNIRLLVSTYVSKANQCVPSKFINLR